MMKLKLIILLLMLVTMSVVNAQDPLSVEPQIPHSGQSIDFLAESWVCYSAEIVNRFVEVDANVVRVFVLVNDVCANMSPVPPSSFTNEYVAGQISGLSAGNYTYKFYRVLNPATFPPLPADYSSYYVSEMAFEVRGRPEPTTVNTTTNLGLMVLILLIISMSFVCVRK
ncbi:MAG: hypothetical protein ACK5L8_12600 [Marinicella pacifica]